MRVGDRVREGSDDQKQDVAPATPPPPTPTVTAHDPPRRHNQSLTTDLH